MTKKKSLFLAAFALIIAASPFGSAPAQADTWETGWDRPGYDYHWFEMVAPRPVVCQWQCQKDAKCKAWTYVKPGIQGELARCWLKYAVPTPYKNNCCTSGIIQ